MPGDALGGPRSAASTGGRPGGTPGATGPRGYARLVPAGADGSLALVSSYDPTFVAALKRSVPPAARRWDGARRRWLLDPAYAGLVADLCAELLGARPAVPATPPAPGGRRPEPRLLTLEYLGAAKPRPSGERTAAGWAGGGWTLSFPEHVLRAWFEPETSGASPGPHGAGRPATLYAVLAVASAATEDELRTAYRRLARTWHPDVCTEPDAAERFIAIRRAYDVLRDPPRRRKYDAGLILEAAATRGPEPAPGRAAADDGGYRAPLRCGVVLAEGTERLGRFVVSRVLQWSDIVDAAGRTLVVSWPPGADAFERRWV